MRLFNEEATQRRHPPRLSRLLAALAYAGVPSLIILALWPRSRFVVRHGVVAGAVHLLRLVTCAGMIYAWAFGNGEFGAEQASDLARDLAMLLLTGVPWLGGMSDSLLLALSFPLGVTWLCSLGGAVIAATGHTADIRAFLNADWSETSEPSFADKFFPSETPEDDFTRDLLEQRLERIWAASRVAAVERQRYECIAAIKGEIQDALHRLAHFNHMLALGELSITRFNALQGELDAYLDALQLDLIDLETRRINPEGPFRATTRPNALDALPEVRAVTLAVVDLGGIPLVTYGHFQIHESLITGMLSAIDSLSEEMFGSRVNKTQLAGGQVVHLARGRQAIAFVVFEDEASPAQIKRLREFLDEFEEANGDALTAMPVDPAALQEIPTPFKFTRRANTDPSVAPLSPITSLPPG